MAIEFPKALEKTKVGRENQILSSEIKPFGRFPVIDQGQTFIAGYSDDEGKVIHKELPVVIFGDHTRSIKYVDFPFILGADGTKVLKPKAELFETKFFYYALMSLDIPNRGYNRHFTLLKEKTVPRPEKDEQRKIASVLSLVQRAIEQQERLIALTQELKKSLMHKLFTEGLRGERQKQTEIGPVPESWEVKPLGVLAKIGNGSTPKRDNVSYWEDGSIPWLTSGKIHERFITEADEFVTELAAKESHLPCVKPGSLLIAITGQGKTLGNSALVTFETCISQHLAYAQFHTPDIVPEFVLWYFQTRYQHLRSIGQAGGSTKGALTCGYLKTYPVPVPSREEQREIADIFTGLEQKEQVHIHKRRTLNDLFRTLLHQLMTAQIRVHDLDLFEFGLDSEAAVP
ncbi:restriction endonuclease subunit S [Candidatus Nitrospira inopinata]|uniref:restriction endonuclease subunit S n=1 Tax=Candidatus Nitrospira inopinata TaxID=1715989 RepID=UPI00138F5ACE|nr:restriction endonuclease subunit S [Candidatus Nitrospira inopinata]